MKRVFSVLLAVLLVLSAFCACDVPGQSDGTTAAPVSFRRGDTTDTAYVNESVGITFTLPKGWRFYTDSEIAAMLQISVEMFKDKDLFTSMNLASFIDFMAVDSLTGNNINMTIENLRASNSTDMTLTQYIKTFKDLIVQQIPNAKYTFSDETPAKLGNTDFTKITATCEYSGVKMVQTYYLMKIDTYIVAVTATSTNGTAAATFEAMFS